ncbi:glutamylcysteine synthetase [Syntrophobotulus glycolicus DSM 8271]|uniref:glutamate--cysteine ligase n=1 Tax=Syntrophobotulus glycolicus (strain DSM 8271 / FlGlyR) TaxID=645991 RepID=F0T2F0_SYNGF|nr:glutamate-cysteine ligase family protein [Syntrophobotulus glycolicus]ADY55268.1 glutamylcysteine synthetase [Syntrophobotulus glycolicus DSM 8271]
MDQALVSEAVYEKYFVPTMKKRDKFIGVELEMPIVNLSGSAVDFSVVHKLTGAFAQHFQMHPTNIDDEGHICSLLNDENRDDLSYDCSYNNLELAMGRARDLNKIQERFLVYYSFIQDFFAPYGYTLTGMGVNPFRKINHGVPILNERYRMLFHYLGLYQNHRHPAFFHPYPDYGTFTSASQVQIDVDYSNLVDIVNVFTKLEPLKALLFANSVMPEDEPGMTCVRDMLWENSMHGLNPKNVGLHEQEFRNAGELLAYIKQTSMYCTMRNGRYLNFHPVPLLEYFASPSITGEYWNGRAYETVRIEPELSDLAYHRTFKFQDVTFRGTVEFRSCCCQPVADSMTVAAFHVGLAEVLGELKVLLDDEKVLSGNGLTTSELRRTFCRGKLPGFVDEEKLRLLELSVLDLAQKGLSQRGFGEEHFLKPLYDRVRRKSNPALDYLRSLENGAEVRDIVRSYAQI